MLNLTEKEQKILNDYYKYNPLLDSDCLMNKICHYMESQIKEIKIQAKDNLNNKTAILLKNPNIDIDKDKLKSMYELFKKYKKEKRNFANVKDENGDEKYKTIEQYNKNIRQEAYLISSDISELANLAVTLCYEIYPKDNKNFAWSIFGEGIIENIKINRQEKCYVPFLDEYGDIEFLGSKYRNYEIEVD
jgi:hypothetical protein